MSLFSCIALLMAAAVTDTASVGTPLVDTASIDTASGDTAIVQEAITPARPDTTIAAEDSLAGISDTTQGPVTPGTDTTAAPRVRRSPARIDTSFRIWHKPHLSIGAAWGLGSFELFDLWEAGLPTTADDIPLGADSTIGGELQFQNLNPIASYNIAFPLFLAYAPLAGENHRLQLSASFARIGKSLDAQAQHDSLGTVWDFQESLGLIWLTAGVSFERALSDRYFQITGADRTAFSIGIGAIPLARLSHRGDFRNDLIDESGSFDNTYYGLGGTWSAGITTFRPLSGGNALEVGIVYQCMYIGEFGDQERELKRGVLNQLAGEPLEPVTVLAHRVRLSVALIFGDSPPAPLSPPPAGGRREGARE
jgi:hypothetical protein